MSLSFSLRSAESLPELMRRISEDPRLSRVLSFVCEKFEGDSSSDPGHDLAHFLRVAFWALRINAELPDPADEREVAAAALLHDIVPVSKDSPLRKDASRLCSEESERILPAMGFPADSVSRVSEAIRCHSFSRGEKAVAPLAQALQDADRLEALGSIGIMRCISTGVRMNAGYFHADDPWAASRPLDDRKYSVDHFFAKLLKLPETMTTDAGRREAEKRTRIMTDFLKSLGDELGHAWPI